MFSIVTPQYIVSSPTLIYSIQRRLQALFYKKNEKFSLFFPFQDLTKFQLCVTGENTTFSTFLDRAAQFRCAHLPPTGKLTGWGVHSTPFLGLFSFALLA